MQHLSCYGARLAEERKHKVSNSEIFNCFSLVILEHFVYITAIDCMGQPICACGH